jgi:nitric oxide reductase large subunit
MEILIPLIWLLVALIGLALYLVPTIVAITRNHHNKAAIIALNIILGWTFIGWIGSLIWSLTSPPRQTDGKNE